MTLPHYAAYKLGAWGVGLGAGAIFAFVEKDVVLTRYLFLYGIAIATIPPTVTGIFSLILQHRVEKKVDGILSKAKEDEQAALKRADHAEGRREGVEATQERQGT
jgi:hypothetical protein